MPLDHDFATDITCPICLAHHEASAALNGTAGPKDGDVSLCIVCGGISVYDSTAPGRLRFPTDPELEEFMADPLIRQAQAALDVVKAKAPLKGNYYPDDPLR